MLPNEVFLSHASPDAAFVMPLVETLRRHGIPVWYSQTNIVGAQQWHDEIGAALSRCDWFALVLSPHAAASMWVKRELLFALQQKRYENRIIPILHQPCDVSQLSWTLPAFQMVDFTTGFDDGCRALMRVWGLGYTPAQNAPP
ncbi:MAG: toll/interleukin-1 receptor domain-containing protein [Armatimonadetes bacterium]|nr:toll/interleukin-1 receptor domain-containing protein [Armatimonadota bacterium]